MLWKVSSRVFQWIILLIEVWGMMTIVTLRNSPWHLRWSLTYNRAKPLNISPSIQHFKDSFPHLRPCRDRYVQVFLANVELIWAIKDLWIATRLVYLVDHPSLNQDFLPWGNSVVITFDCITDSTWAACLCLLVIHHPNFDIKLCLLNFDK